MSSYGIVGRAGLLVEPTFRGVQRKVRDGIGAPLAREAPLQGRNLGDGIVAATTGVFKWGGIAAGAALGTAITKGFGRLRAMEDATAKIEGLGYATQEVDQIMTDVQGALDGTMFLYSEGADVAAGALAAGVEQGEELESYLRLTADAATQAGIDFGTMGTILNKVEGDGRLMGDTVQQLAENGVYILPALAEEFGVTGEEMRKMVSNGEVDAATFRRIMEEQYGGSSERAAETMTGAMSLAWTAIGQLGEKLIAEVYPYLRDFFKGFYDWVQEISPAVEDFGVRVGKALGSVIGWLTENPGAVKAFAAAIGAVFAAMAAYTVVVKVQGAIAGLRFAFANLNVVMAVNPVAIWVAAIAALVVGLVWAYNNVDWFRNAVQTAWDAITTVFTWAWENVIQPVVNWIGEAWNWLADVFVSVWENYLSPVFEGIGTVVTWLWGNIIQPYIGFVIGLWMSLGEVFMWVWENVLSHVFNAIGVVAVWLWENVLSPVFTWIGDHWQYILLGMQLFWETVLKPVFNAIAAVAVWLWEEVLSPVFSWIGEHWSSVMDIMSWAWTYILQPVFNAIAFVARWLWEKVLEPVFSFIGRHWDKILTAMKWAWDYILKPVWDAIVAVATWLWEKVLEPIFSWIGDHWDEILFAMKYTWENYLLPAWERMKAVGTWLWEKLRDIFTNISDKWTWMKNKVVDVYEKHIKPVFDKFGDIVSNLKDKFKSGVDNIKKQWDRLKSIAAKPVKFVIEDIFNDGLINALNKVPGVNIPDIPTPKWANEYASGGWTGPGSKYTPAGVVHADEYVLNKEATNSLRRQVGLAGLDYMNRHGRFPGYDTGGLVQPVHGPLTSRYGPRWGGMHSGVDWAVPVGTPVLAALAGTVVKAAWNAVTGRTGMGMLLAHSGNRNTYYGHLSAFRKNEGDQVAAGETIGLSGNTGNSTGPHLHFETWTGGSPVNPLGAMGGLPTSADGGSGWFDPLAPIRAIGEKITGWLTSKFPEAEFMVDAAVGLAKDGFDQLMSWAQSILPGHSDTGTGVSGAGMGAGSAATREAVRGVAEQYGWHQGAQWNALSELIQRESSWNPNAANPSSSARGLFQKMTSIHGPVASTAAGQAGWGLDYIKSRHTNPISALAFHDRNNWYADGGLVKDALFRDQGGNLPPGLSMVLNKTGRDEAILNSRQWQDIHTLAQRGSGGPAVNIENAYALSTDALARDIETSRRRAAALAPVL